MRFQTFENDVNLWTKCISVDENREDIYPQLKINDSIQHIVSHLQNTRFNSKPQSRIMFSDVPRIQRTETEQEER